MPQINNSEKYTVRQDAAEGLVFYHNKLAYPGYVKTYFPPTDGENDNQYKRRPKIAVPITSSIIDRIVNILNSHTVISVDDQQSQDIIDNLSEQLNLSEFIRDMFVNTLATGNNLTVMRIGQGRPELENWDGNYVNFDYADIGVYGYEYTLKDGLMVPVLSDETKPEEIRSVFIDNFIFGTVAHNLGFNPTVAMKSIDKYASGVYGKPYSLRFDDLVIEFNHIISQMSKSIKILQNIWITNLSTDNPDEPIRLNPDTINFLGPDGILEQVTRQLNLSEEKNLLEILEHHIAKASQVPAEVAGLRDAGKLPSGIALQIVLQPLVELIDRLRPMFYQKVSELANKLIRMQYIIDGRQAPKELNITIKSNENLFPEDRGDKINEIIILKKEGLIDDITAKLMLEPLIKMNLTNKGN